MEYISAKNIVSGYSDNGWFGCEYNMNIYKGCSHGCIYCDSRSECYQIEDFSRVRAKKDALEIIEKNLRSKRKKGVIATGGMSDPYNPFEEKLKLTRGALNLIERYRFGVSPLTKSSLITRDIDIIKKISEHSPVSVMMTVTAADDVLSKKIEPNVCPSSERFAAIKEFSDAGIHTGILLMPMLPFIEDTEENVVGIVEKAKASGARFIYPSFGMTLRSGQREYFYDELDKHFPGMSNRYIERFGGDYGCSSPKYSELKELFQRECRKLGLLFRMRDIIFDYKKGYIKEQLSWI